MMTIVIIEIWLHVISWRNLFFSALAERVGQGEVGECTGWKAQTFERSIMSGCGQGIQSIPEETSCTEFG